MYLAEDINLDSSEEWEPIGYYSQDTESVRKVLENEKNKPFSGTFDGKCHTINNMYINTTDKVQGLFGLVINGEIKNINIAENCSINTGGNSGSVVGYMYNTGKISGCKNYANLNHVSGGIVGSITGKVQNCYNAKMVKGDRVVGGIVGYLEGAYHNLIENCYNIGNVTGVNGNVGEIFGRNTNNMSEIVNCYTSSDTFSAENLGGAFKEDTNNINDGYPILQWQ